MVSKQRRPSAAYMMLHIFQFILLLEPAVFLLTGPPCVKQRKRWNTFVQTSTNPHPLPVHSSLPALFMYSKEIIYSDGMETSQHAF